MRRCEGLHGSSSVQDSNSQKQIEQAVELLQRGVPVAIPTETVYGLAAPINSPSGIEQIFRLKDRPFFDPLIVHIQDQAELGALCKPLSLAEKVLISAFWPGPCTFVLGKQPQINSMISAGLETLGIRMPSHPVTREILRRVGVPLAAPSANKFGRTSPTTAAHVRAEWPSGEVFVVDAGQADFGLESTVLRVGGDEQGVLVEILRPGVIGAKEISTVLQGASLPYRITTVSSQASPGHDEHHYQPRVPLVILPERRSLLSEQQLQTISSLVGSPQPQYVWLELSQDPRLAARELYSELHRHSNSGAQLILAPFAPSLRLDPQSSWFAIWDRLKRAATLILD